MKHPISRIITISVITIFFVVPAIAKSNPSPHFIVGTITDSAVPAEKFNEQLFFRQPNKEGFISIINNFYNEEKYTAELASIETDYNKTGNNKKALARLLRALKANKILRSKKVSQRFFTDLAKISARLKLYSLAMQSYYEASDEENVSPFFVGNHRQENKFTLGYSDLSSLYNSQLHFVVDTANISDTEGKEIESLPISVTNIFDSFDDHKPAENYALLVGVKQPLSGKRKPFTGIGNVGHMFITLVKYNSDNSIVSRSFGFYPDKHSSFVATPLHPAAPPVFKDDALHDWDELAGKFISKKRFEKILQLLDGYERRRYNLNHNNCTDFGLTAAAIGGITVYEANSKWPFGKGNNPANAGQSILERKIRNADTGDLSGLFICSSRKLEAFVK